MIYMYQVELKLKKILQNRSAEKIFAANDIQVCCGYFPGTVRIIFKYVSDICIVGTVQVQSERYSGMSRSDTFQVQKKTFQVPAQTAEGPGLSTWRRTIPPSLIATNGPE